MKKIFIFLSLLFLFVSCPFSDISVDDKIRGKIISSYPDWCNIFCDKKGYNPNGAFGAFGYSAWHDWQSDNGKLLHSFVGDDVVPDDFDGKYRIEAEGQFLYIGFNDSESTTIGFFNYIGAFDDANDKYIEIDTNNATFEYDCWCRKFHTITKKDNLPRDERIFFEFDDKCGSTNRSKIILSEIDDTTFNYRLVFGGKTIIDESMSNIRQVQEKADISANSKDDLWWIPTEVKEVVGESYFINGYYGRTMFLSADNGKIGCSFSNNMLNMGVNHCFEGIKLKDIDVENKTISFYLQDRDKSDFADYFKLSLKNLDKQEARRMLSDSGSHIDFLDKGTLGFYKIVDGDDEIVKFYDGDKLEFVFGNLAE